MNNEVFCDIFISYAKEDESFARRLFYDFKRHHLKVWDFKINSQFGINFISEFLTQIDLSNYFCLIDTDNARKASYVKMEAEHAFRKQKKLLLCRFESVINGNPFFGDYEYITHFNLYQDYNNEFKKICRHLSIEYTPDFTIPRDKDFLYELTYMKLHENKIDTQTWRKLLEEYELFRYHFDNNKTFAKVKIENIISDCELIGVKLFSPYLALGNLYAIIGEHEEALKIYMKASILFKADPRILAGLGGAQYHLKNYDKAVKFYCECLTLIYSSSEKSHKEHIIEIAHNLYQALIETDSNSPLEVFLNTLVYDEKAEIIALKGKIFFRKARYSEAATYLEKAYFAFKFHHPPIDNLNTKIYFLNVAFDLVQTYSYLSINSIKKDEIYQIQVYQKQMRLLMGIISGLKIELSETKIFLFSQYLAEAYRNVGKCLLDVDRNVNEAITYYLQAIQIMPSIKYLSELAMIHYRLDNSENSLENVNKYLNECFLKEKQKTITSLEDVYYLGLCYFLNGKIEIAKYMFERSNQKNWPYYNQLLE